MASKGIMSDGRGIGLAHSGRGQGGMMEADVLKDYLMMQGYSYKTAAVVAAQIRSNRILQDVTADVRAIKAMLAQTNQATAQIHEETRIIPGLVKSLKNIFSFSSSEVDRHLPKK